MHKKILEKLRRSRETNIHINGLTFVIRRPTVLQLSMIPEEERKESDYTDPETKEVSKIKVPTDEAMIRRFVVNWVGVKETDIISSGDPIPADFDSNLLVEWLQEKTDMWLTLAQAIWNIYLAHNKEVNDALGKPEDGLSEAS